MTHPGRLSVVVAHPDDETFGCGSLLLHAAARGLTTAVVCATRGEAGESGGVDAPAPDELGRVREGELRTAAGLLGVSRVDLLTYRDSGMSGPAGPGTLVDADADAVAAAVRAHLEDFRPTLVITLDGGDGHRDHVAIRDATLSAVGSSAWAVDRVYLQCLPQSLMRRWVEYMAATDPSWEHLEAGMPGTPDEEITTVVDTSRHFAGREQAIRAHRSQRSPFDSLPLELRRDFLTSEHLRRVRPPWPGGPRESEMLPR
jgi:LmbE family N-acetylglucosaminyl deacetylase